MKKVLKLIKDKVIREFKNPENHLIFYVFGLYYLIKLVWHLPCGDQLSKSDWLSFFGSFIGAWVPVFTCYFTLLQNGIFKSDSEEELNRKRIENIQPIFSVSLSDTNFFIQENINLLDCLRPCKNFTLSIHNYGCYPVFHFRIFNQYLYDSFPPSQLTNLQCIFHDSLDSNDANARFLVLDETIHRNYLNLPEEICIEYVDIDGNSMYQEFRFADFSGNKTYILKSKGAINSNPLA